MKWLYSGYAVIVSIALLVGLKVVDPTPLQNLRNQTFDAYQQLDEIKQSNEVVIVNIGEKSLQQWGQWPWPRQNFAQMIHDLRQKNQGIIGLTVIQRRIDSRRTTLASWIKGNGIVLSTCTKGKDPHWHRDRLQKHRTSLTCQNQ